MRKRLSIEDVRARTTGRYPTKNEKLEPGRASNYFIKASKYYEKYPEIGVVLYIRVSRHMQKYTKNFISQEQPLRKWCKRRNIPIIACYTDVCSGRAKPNDRQILIEAVKKANETGAVILATSSDRFLRNKYFHTTNNRLVLPTESEYEGLRSITGDVLLLCRLNPDMHPDRVKHFHSIWGQCAKQSKGGRPKIHKAGYKKRWRERRMPRVLRLYNKGRGLREIARITHYSLTTIHRWIQTSKLSGNLEAY